MYRGGTAFAVLEKRLCTEVERVEGHRQCVYTCERA